MTQLTQVASGQALERWIGRLQAAIDERPAESDEREGLLTAKEWFEEECWRGRCGVKGPGSMRCVLRAGHPAGWHDNGGAAWLDPDGEQSAGHERGSPPALVGSRARERCDSRLRSLQCELAVEHGGSHRATDATSAPWTW